MSAAAVPLVEMRDVSLSFGGVHAVEKLSLTLEPGRITGLIGPNGAGKTTVINILTGLLSPSMGSVVFGDKKLPRGSPAEIARYGIARTFQHVKLRASMSLIDNVLLGTYLRTTAGLIGGALRLDRAEEARARFEAGHASATSAMPMPNSPPRPTPAMVR